MVKEGLAIILLKIHSDTYWIHKKDPFCLETLIQTFTELVTFHAYIVVGGFGQVRLGQGETKMHRSQLYWIHSDTYWIHQIFKGREDVVSVARRQKFPHHTMAGFLHFCPKNIGIFIPKNVQNYCEK